MFYSRVNELPQMGSLGPPQTKNNTNVLGIITLIIFILFALNILRLWWVLPYMERAGRETVSLISGGSGASVSIINTEVIPQIRIFFMLSLISFGILDGVFSFMLLKGNPKIAHVVLIIPLFILYLVARIASGFIVTLLTSSALFDNNPWGALASLYISLIVFSILSTVILLIFHTKIFTQEKKKAIKILVSKSEYDSL